MKDIVRTEQVLSRVAELLRRGGAGRWAHAFEGFRDRIATEPDRVGAEVLATCGGMGSFNAVVLYRDGRPLAAGNRELDRLREELHRLCRDGPDVAATRREDGGRDGAGRMSASEAVVTYLGYGRAPSPRENGADVAAACGNDGGEVVCEVEALLAEADAVPVGWDRTTLAEGGQIVRAAMRARHPTLSGEALDAIAWKVTFDWR